MLFFAGISWILVEDAFWSFCVILTLLVILGSNFFVFAKTNKKREFSDPLSWSGMGWSGIMEWNGVEWILVEDAFWSFWVILTLFGKCGPNLVVFD